MSFNIVFSLCDLVSENVFYVFHINCAAFHTSNGLSHLVISNTVCVLWGLHNTITFVPNVPNMMCPTYFMVFPSILFT